MRKTNRRRGNTLVEFALVSVFLVPLMMGTVNIGMNLGRAIQVTQVSRDTGHMYVRDVNFTVPANQNIIVRLAQGLGLALGQGNGKIVLSKVMYITENDCTAAGLTVEECVNLDQPVITQQITFGNLSLRDSALGQVPTNKLDADGNVSPADYLVDINLRAAGFDQILVLQTGEFAYVSEAIFTSPEYDFPGFFEGTNLYARTIF